MNLPPRPCSMLYKVSSALAVTGAAIGIVGSSKSSCGISNGRMKILMMFL